MHAHSDTVALERERPPARIRIAHLGLGAFHRAHQAWYTERVLRLESGGWGIEAFTGRRPDAAIELEAQNGVYTLITRAADGDTFDQIESIISAVDGSDYLAWIYRVSHPDTAIVTLTVTEAGYYQAPGGGLDAGDPNIREDLRRLRDLGKAPLVTAPGRLIQGLAVRRKRGSGPIAILSCDNLAGNGEVTRRVVSEMAELVDPTLAGWITHNVSFVSSMVDRITPATTDEDRATVRDKTGRADRAPIVTEPFSEWIIAGKFPAGRPAWEKAGVRFVEDINPFERRKLWLLNAGHSLLAYGGLPRGHHTVDEAFSDPELAVQLDLLWAEAAEVLPLPPSEIREACAALRVRFANPRIRHHLEQIALGGAHKLTPRIFDLIRARRAAGLPDAVAAPRVAADWLDYLARPQTPSAEGAIFAGERTAERMFAILAPDLNDLITTPAFALRERVNP